MVNVVEGKHWHTLLGPGRRDGREDGQKADYQSRNSHRCIAWRVKDG